MSDIYVSTAGNVHFGQDKKKRMKSVSNKHTCKSIENVYMHITSRWPHS